MKQIKIALALVLALAMVFAVGCSKKEEAAPAAAAPAESSTPNVDAIKAAGKIVMLTNAGFPPYEFLGANNEVIGVDAEIAGAVAEKLGVELEIVDMDFDAIIFAIQSGKGDLGVAGMTNTEERQKTVDFSVNYVDSQQMIIVAEGSAIQGPDDLKGKTIGVQMGTTGDLFVTDNIEGANVQRYKTAPDAGAELAAGKLDAVVVDAGPAAQIAAANANLTVLETPANDEPEQYAIAIAKDKPDLKAVVDEVITELLAADQINAWVEEYNAISEAAQ